MLNSILEQTVKADKIIVNLAYNEYIPHDVFVFLESNGIEVFYTDDTKVYKKFIPTLKRYPKACVINIDDDLIYPPTLIEDFISVHKQCPNNPVCGNHAFLFGRYCHCGEASLTKLEYFGSYINEIDAELMASCSSSDIVFTYLATWQLWPDIHTYHPEVFTGQITNLSIMPIPHIQKTSLATEE